MKVDLKRIARDRGRAKGVGHATPRTLRYWLRGLALALVLFVMLAPVVWVLLTSLKSVGESQRIPPTLIPEDPSLQPYRFVLFENPQVDFIQYIINSVWISVITIAVTIVIASLGAFALAYLHPPFRKAIASLLLMAYLFPGPSIIVPVFKVIQQLRLLNTLWALIILNVAFAVPFAVWMLAGYFQRVPRSMIDSAFIDGATRVRTLRSIVLPVARPGLVAVAIFSFLISWNQYLFALLVISQQDKYTLTLGLAQYIGAYTTYNNYLSAASIIALVPAAVLFVFLSKHVVRGLASGAIKG